MVTSILAIALGAALGALSRWGLGLALNGLFPAIPPGTLVANLVGGYLVGLALPLLPLLESQGDRGSTWGLFAVTGFLGGLTTFSAFSGEVALLLQQGRWLLASGAISLHVGGSLAMTLAGFATVALLRR